MRIKIVSKIILLFIGSFPKFHFVDQWKHFMGSVDDSFQTISVLKIINRTKLHNIFNPLAACRVARRFISTKQLTTRCDSILQWNTNVYVCLRFHCFHYTSYINFFFHVYIHFSCRNIIALWLHDKGGRRATRKQLLFKFLITTINFYLYFR